MSNLTITQDAEKDQKFDEPVRRQCLVLCFTFHCKMQTIVAVHGSSLFWNQGISH